MSVPATPHHQRIQRIRELLNKFRVEDHLIDAAGSQQRDLERTLLHKQQAVELKRRLAELHFADLADLLATLSTMDRLRVWSHIPVTQRGEVLLELDDAVLQQLLENTPSSDVLLSLQQLDADDLAYLSDVLPPELLQQTLSQRVSADRERVDVALSCAPETIGHWMSSEMLTVRRQQTLGEVQAMLLKMHELPTHTDKLLVLDQRGLLCGILYLQDILLNPAQQSVADSMKTDIVSFHAGDLVEDVARAFERYDLTSAPVINERGKLIGRITVDVVMDFLRAAAEMDALNVAGVLDTEDLFSSIWNSARNRWLWLAINLVSAFVISRIIGVFEGTIAQLVALASLMPIVASVAGNTGNQTTAIVIRSIATRQIHADNIYHLFRKEISISILNGVVWGAVVGVFAYVFYQNLSLSLVVSLAMLVTFMLAAIFGVGAPIMLNRLGRDPAMGSSVILTGITDALGFLVFLSLAAVFLT